MTRRGEQRPGGPLAVQHGGVSLNSFCEFLLTWSTVSPGQGGYAVTVFRR